MKIQKTNIFVTIVGLFILSFLLERIVKPISLHFSSPFDLLNYSYLFQYPFTIAIIIIRAISLMLTPLFLYSFIPHKYFFKVFTLFFICLFSQLLSIQEIISNTTILPIEWALSLTVAGVFLIPFIVLYFLKGSFHSAKSKFYKPKTPIKYI